MLPANQSTEELVFINISKPKSLEWEQQSMGNELNMGERETETETEKKRERYTAQTGGW